MDMWEIGEALGFSQGETRKVVDYLEGEGLVSYEGIGGTISITHQGIKEMEESKEDPGSSTDHFPPRNVINVETMVGSQIQQGTRDSDQQHEVTINYAALQGALEQLDAILDDLPSGESTEQVKAHKETIEAQLDAPKPNEGIIKRSSEKLSELLRSISIGAASQALAPEVRETVESILSNLPA